MNNVLILLSKINNITYVLDPFLVDSLASFLSLLTNHNALQHGVNHRDSIGVIKGYNLHL